MMKRKEVLSDDKMNNILNLLVIYDLLMQIKYIKIKEKDEELKYESETIFLKEQIILLEEELKSDKT